MEQEPPRPPCTTLKDSRPTKVDYSADPRPKIPPPAPPTVSSLPPLVTQRALLGDEEAKAECLRLLGNVPSQEHDTQKNPRLSTRPKGSSPHGFTSRHLPSTSGSTWSNMMSGRCAHTPLPSQSCSASYCLTHRAKSSWGCLSPSPWWTCFVPFCNDLMT